MIINYRIEALNILLNENCVLAKYYTLIPIRNDLINYFLSINCFTKKDCLNLNDHILIESPLENTDNIKLFKRFLSLYDTNDQKFKEIEKLSISSREKNIIRELFLLPGVKTTRAMLYYNSGFKSLENIASSSVKEIQERTLAYITNNELNLKIPLTKEVATHIAVAKVFTIYKCD